MTVVFSCADVVEETTPFSGENQHEGNGLTTLPDRPAAAGRLFQQPTRGKAGLLCGCGTEPGG